MHSAPKVLVAGAWTYPWHHEACARSLGELGAAVVPVGWHEDFYASPFAGKDIPPKDFQRRIELRLVAGPTVDSWNRRMLNAVRAARPDIIFLHSTLLLQPSTLDQIRRLLPSAVIAQYCNDDPFAHRKFPSIFRHIRRSIPECDIHFAYRHSNVEDYLRAGAPRARLLRSYFIPEDDFRVEIGAGDARFDNDIVFAGHFEADERTRALTLLAESGMAPTIFGPGWNRAEIGPGHPLSARAPRPPVFGADYRKAISGARIALCFLSKLNRDTYTRRSFQIPAMRTFQLSEYSDDLASLFTEGEDIEFFRSPEELRDKARFYLASAEARERIAAAGYRRVVRDGHDVRSRMRDVLAECKTVR